MFLIRKTIFQWQRLNLKSSSIIYRFMVCQSHHGLQQFQQKVARLHLNSTRAEASVLPLKVHKRLNNRPVIEHITITLSAYGGSVIKPVGTCTLKCKGKISSPITFYVVPIAAQLILGLTDCIRLGLIQRVHTLQFLTYQKILSEDLAIWINTVSVSKMICSQ